MKHLRPGLFLVCLCGMLALAVGSNWFAQGQVTPKKIYTPEELKSLTVGPSCITSDCHEDLKKLRFRHGPTAQDKCDPCHQSVGGKHVFKSPAEGNKLCLECHDPVPLGKVEHTPVRESCLDCHSIHGANNRFFLQEGEGAAVCKKCHKDLTKDMEFIHGPLAQGLCLACHEPHESNNESLLIAPPDQFCVTCHVEIRQDSMNAIVVHKPFVENCNGCHSGHGSNYRYFLSDPENALCRKCHEKDIEASEKFKYRHTAITEKGECSTCHTAHFSNVEKLLREASEPLCLNCHNRTYEMSGGEQVPNVQAQIAGAKYLHGPIRDKTCIPCHAAHGSNYVGMLILYFPPRFYAPFSESNYELCFHCHDRKVVLKAESLDTEFRNGSQNLHYLHVNREKGRTCRACHAEHASNNPVHIRDSVPYGKWTMEIDFDKSSTGGSCATGCHARYGYDRANPVKNATQTVIQTQ